jgi:hypothetical protein
MTIVRATRRRAGTFVAAVRNRLLRWASTPPIVERRLVELESITAEMRSTLSKVRDQLTKVGAQARDAQRLSNEDGRALQFVLLDINEIRRDLDAVLEGDRP